MRQRPGMYCDRQNKPLSTLETMLGGYDAALTDHGVPDGGRGFNEAFRGYLLVRFGWSTSCGWAVAIRDHLKTEEDELAKFFAVVAEFKRVVEADPDDLPRLARRLEAISLRMDGFRRRRREWVVKQIREDRGIAPYR